MNSILKIRFFCNGIRSQISNSVSTNFQRFVVNNIYDRTNRFVEFRHPTNFRALRVFQVSGLTLSSLMIISFFKEKVGTSFVETDHLTDKTKIAGLNEDQHEVCAVVEKKAEKRIVIDEFGNRYEGDLVNGVRHGKGIYTYANGSCYEGDFVNGVREGKGIYTFAEGCKYEGDFVGGKQTGKGILTLGSLIYEGNFVDGKLEGEGTVVDGKGNRFIGNFVDGKKEGRGIFTYANGSCFDGHFLDDEESGKGSFIFSNGDVYEGDLLEGNLRGHGVYTFANGSKYEGTFIEDQLTGEGIYTSVDGISYDIRSTSLLNRDSLEKFMGSEKFIELILGLGKEGCLLFIPLKIICGWLDQNNSSDYEQVSRKLKQALSFYQLETKEALSQIQDHFKAKEPILLPCFSKRHATGLLVNPKADNTVEFSIFNSGAGLNRHVRITSSAGKIKYSTVKKYVIPENQISEIFIQQVLSNHQKSVQQLYNRFEAVSGSRNVEDCKPIFQTAQKGNNCSIEWIFAFLKNNLSEREYLSLRIEFFKFCRNALMKNTDSNFERINYIEELNQKISKRENQLSRI